MSPAGEAEEQLSDVASLVVFRIIAKKRRGEISEEDFCKIAGLNVPKLIQVVSTKSDRKDVVEIGLEECRKALELASRKGCGLCKSTGLQDKSRRIICKCVRLENYRGDSILPREHLLSNEYFEDEFSKYELGRDDIVRSMGDFVVQFVLKGRK